MAAVDNGQHPRKGSRSFSFHSDKSNKGPKLFETTAEKESRRLHSKADPTLAMNEAEPAAVQATERSVLAPLRSVQHKDVYGNPIEFVAEPDKSNPTRSRWERPLDTIRSFEAAIDGPYRRPPLNRPQSEADWNRRGSYYGNGNRNYAASRAPSMLSVGGNGNRYPQDNYYGSRPTSHFDPRPSPRNSYHEPQQYGGYGPYGGQEGYPPNHGGHGGPSGQYGGRHRAARMQSAPQLHNHNRRDPNSVYPTQHRDRSYETVTTASGGSGGDQGSYQTDPSSDNGSVDRVSPMKPPPVPAHDYGIGFSGQSAYQPQGFTFGPNGNNPNTIQKKPVPGTLASTLPPAVPRKDVMPPQANLAPAKPQPEKRKSWLFRRFSRNS
ncbi:hypothetical protein jhhlp_007109 [Lomentospora prolificans]|uniref:DUF2406 domain-containing protein n=1 Tax=Lomentospora prolificans TaxID=41688 RepID=A0A2N3N1S5_9PEZI|nr:hypothetical protein jhhlp_007109 [Lomentospora prolificans]